MNDRWKQIEKIYHLALERPESERVPFLQEACAGDEQLRREVESLLAQEASGDELLERPALEVAAKMMGEDRGESMIGRKLGSYEIQSLLGAGGMGEVYKARDIKLRRDVAIKVIPTPFAQDPERVARFRREAQLLASLNHPNIAAIYGLEEVDGSICLVMELVPGETLSERISRKGAAPVEESLSIAKQIAEALEHAHEKNIIHRDLKPANVKVTPEGKVKVLDFGLAKAFGDANDVTASQAPTMITAEVRPGMIMGTPPYMSPEQASGKTVDKRTDIFAFGCVLYELLTGKQAFAGASVTEILGAVLHKKPDWAALPSGMPPAIHTLLRRCLQKDARERFRDAGDIRIQIEEARAASSASGTSVAFQALPAPRRWLTYAAVACVAAVITGIAVWNLKLAPAIPKTVMRATIQLGSEERIPANDFAPLAISPDGSHLAYAAQKGSQSPQLYVRSMDSLEDRAIPGTENGSQPFFSPDGQWIGFSLTNGNNLKKVPVNGGPVTTVLNTSAGARGGAWSADDRIILPLTGQSALSIVSAAGGTAEALTKLEKGDTTHRWPEALPGGKAVLYVSAHSLTLFDDAQIMAVRLGTGERKVLVQGGTFPHYVPTGHLVYYRAGNIMAAPFDPESLEVKGSPVAVMEGVRSSGTGGAHFAVSNNGTLVYLPGSATGTARSTLVWVDRKGVSTPLNLPPHAFGASSGPKLSPDGKFAALLINEPTNDAWVYDLGRDTLTRLSFDGTPVFIAWSPDGKRIVYYSTKSGPTIFWKPADGSGAEEPLVKSDVQLFTGAFTPDGRIYIYSQNSPKTGRDIWYETVDDHKQHVFLQTPFNETAARFSPDGRYVAYLSDESGRNEIYVQPFPGPGGKYQISTEGGQEMAWGADGEIFYRNGDKMMAVPVKTQPSFEVGKPQLLFEAPYLQNHTGGGALYDVSRDGQRFLMLKPVESQTTASTQINMVLNWFEELKQKVPTGK